MSEKDEIITETVSDNKSSSLYSEDLAPIVKSKRTWGTWNYAALWISMSLCIPTYMLASSLIEGGMNWWQAILTIFLGNTVVLIPMILISLVSSLYYFAHADFIFHYLSKNRDFSIISFCFDFLLIID